MGHEIHYWTADEDCNRSEILNEIQDYSNEHGDGYYSHITWHNVLPLADYCAAKSFLEQEDDCNYDDHAVRYYDYSKLDNTAKIKELRDKKAKIVADRLAYEQAHSISKLAAKYIGCPACGSKLSKDRLRSQICPLCRTDLRSHTVLERLKGYDVRIESCSKKIDEEIKKQKNKAIVKWLIKFEFHS